MIRTISIKVLLNTVRHTVPALLLCATAVNGRAQTAPVPLTPQVTAHGRGEIDVVPDRGEIMVQVETRASDGAHAGASNASIARAVLDTLRAGFSLSDRDVATIGYNIAPQMVYTNDGHAPKITGYVASSTVRIRTAELSRMGAMIDAALAKGATSVAGLSFYLANPDDARRRALASAVESARRDAEAMATAAGGKLGALIDITTEADEGFQPRPQMFAMAIKAATPTPIDVGEQKVTATITARWRFVAPGQ